MKREFKQKITSQTDIEKRKPNMKVSLFEII
jgi:hypothetical protein